MSHVNLLEAIHYIIYQLELQRLTQASESGINWGDVFTTTVTALGSLLVAWILFLLTKRKDRKEFRGKLYGDIISTQHEFLRCCIQRFTVANLYFTAAAQHSVNGTKGNLERMIEKDKELTIAEKEFHASLRMFFTNIGIYIYYKAGKTQMNDLKHRLSNKGVVYSLEAFEDVSNQQEIEAAASAQINAYNSFFAEEIEGLTNQMVELVLNNK